MTKNDALDFLSANVKEWPTNTVTQKAPEGWRWAWERTGGSVVLAYEMISFSTPTGEVAEVITHDDLNDWQLSAVY